jgi:hypothetical protein
MASSMEIAGQRLSQNEEVPMLRAAEFHSSIVLTLFDVVVGSPASCPAPLVPVVCPYLCPPG